MNIFFLLLALFSFFNNKISCIIQKKGKSSKNVSFLHDVIGDPYCYCTTLFLGKEKASQTFILDTASSLTTSPCDKCTSCSDEHHKFKLEDESQIIQCNSYKCKLLPYVMCQSNECSFTSSYEEGSMISGFYVNEDIYFQKIDSEMKITKTPYNIPIGCTTKEMHIFQLQEADGVMGLNNNDKSFVNLLYKSNIIKKNIFSLCFSHEGGYFSIGKIVTTQHFYNIIKYVNLLNINDELYKDLYNIQLNYIQIGDRKVQYNGTAFIDSGTTLTYFPSKIFRAIMRYYLKICKKCGNLRRLPNYGYCAEFKDERELNEIVNEWKNIIIGLDGYDFIWEPHNFYLIYDHDEENGANVCLGFEESVRNNILLGTTFMHNYDIIFDKEKERIGFVQADCNGYKSSTNILDEDNYNIEDKEKILNTNDL